MGIPRQQRTNKWAGWGEIEFTSKTHMNRTVELFHEKAKFHGSSAYWVPQTSEVLHDSDEDVDIFTLTEWRELAYKKALDESYEHALGGSDE